MGLAKDALCFCCYLLAMVAVTAVIGLTVSVFVEVEIACVVPFRASVDEASLARLSLSLAAPGNNNSSTPPPPASSSALSYDLALAVALRRNSQAAGASRAALLDAELGFLGRPLAFARRLAGPEWEAVGGPGPGTGGEPGKMVYRLAWNGEMNATLALGPDEAAAFAAESAAGVFELELIVSGGFWSAARFLSGWCEIRVSCPLRLSVSTAAAPAPFERVECAPSQAST
ncbi:unnamed protein product [Urochloa humidicola]